MADPKVNEYGDMQKGKESDGRAPDTGLAAASNPSGQKYIVSEAIPEAGRLVRHTRPLAFLGLVVALLALAAAWRWTPLQDWLAPESIGAFMWDIPSPGVRALVAVAAIALASLAMVPVTLLAVVGGIVFDGWDAFVYVVTGAMASAAIGFVGGRFLSRGAVERLAGSRLGRLSEGLARRGIISVAALRLVPIAPFTVFNLVAGASHLNFWQFFLGSLLGMAPGLCAITVFSSSLWGVVTPVR